MSVNSFCSNYNDRLLSWHTLVEKKNPSPLASPQPRALVFTTQNQVKARRMKTEATEGLGLGGSFLSTSSGMTGSPAPFVALCNERPPAARPFEAALGSPGLSPSASSRLDARAAILLFCRLSSPRPRASRLQPPGPPGSGVGGRPRFLRPRPSRPGAMAGPAGGVGGRMCPRPPTRPPSAAWRAAGPRDTGLAAPHRLRPPRACSASHPVPASAGSGSAAGPAPARSNRPGASWSAWPHGLEGPWLRRLVGLPRGPRSPSCEQEPRDPRSHPDNG